MDKLKLKSCDTTYEKLDDPDVDPAFFQLSRPKHRTFLSKLWLCTRIVLLAISIPAWATSLWLTYTTARELNQARSLLLDLSSNIVSMCSSHSSPTRHPSKPDGSLSVPGYQLLYNTSYCNGWTDPAGAKTRGCVLDPSQGGWVHELCHDDELLQEWLDIRDFGWFLDPEGKQPISQKRVWAADIPGGVFTPLYTTGWDFHIEHCRFVVRLKIKNGMRKDRGLGYLALDVGHLDHCVEMMMEMNTPEKKGKDLNRVVLGSFGGGTEGFGLAGECYMPAA